MYLNQRLEFIFQSIRNTHITENKCSMAPSCLTNFEYSIRYGRNIYIAKTWCKNNNVINTPFHIK